MSINKKIFCLLIILIFCLGVSSVSAADINSDIVASDDTAIDSGIIGEASFDENLGAESTFVVTNSTFNNYFTDGELNNNVSAGSTLDFQGTFTGEDYKVNITKPVNIISSTGDALFNEIGKKDSTGGCFHISSGGSGTNVTDLNFINSAFYVTNASGVTIENINMVANMSGVGSGTGFMCVQAGSRYVTVKNSYFENRGTGSSIVVFGYSDYCTFDNNEVFINGSSGNAIYITSYVPAKYKGNDPTGNVISNNYIHGKFSGLAFGLVVAGNENFIEHNLIDSENGGSGIAGQSFSTQYNNTYTDNTLTGGCSFTAGEDSYVSGNSVEGSMTAGSNSIVEDNKILSLSLSKPNVVVNRNVIGENGVNLNSAALNTTLTNNVILSKVNVKSKDNTIQKNTIEADDEYAVDLGTTTGNEVSFNNLASNNFTGDAAVNAGENNSVHDNGAMDNIVTEDNFFYFFDENGNYRNLNFTELIFKGDFYSLVDAITINQTLSIEGLDASLNNMAFILLADGITLNDLKLNFDQAPVLSNGSAILIDAPNVSISEIIIDYELTESADTYAIYAVNADNLTIKDNNITYDVKNDGSAVNNIIYVSDSSNVLVDSNFVFASIPSCYVDWKYNPATGAWVKAPLSEGLVFDECEDLIIVNNEIGIDYNDVVGAYDTIYAIDITNSRNVDVTDNNIVALGHTYVYALYVESDGLTVDNNNISSSSDNNYANGIEIEASTDAVISNNNIEVIAPSFVYPIYSGMNGGDLEVDYIGNNIYALSDIAYGMELCGSKENVYENTITVEGNKTTALAVKSKEVRFINNIINALGDNLGNSSSVDSFAAMTVGINLENSNAIVEENTINSNSRGIFVTDGGVTIENNKITVNDNGLDDSYAIIAEGPEILIDSNEITYVGATTGETVNNAIYLKTCEAQVIGNDFDISIPSAYVKWVEEPAGSGNWVKLPISQGLVFEDCLDLVVDSNNIELEATSVVGAYDTIYVIDITDSDNVNVTNNNINALGHDYIYGLYIESDGALVDANNFTIESDTNYANGIEIEASVNATVSNNNIEVTAPSFAYPVYSGMNGGDLEVDYIGNNIYAVSDIVYGMELCGSEENVYENTITVEGNKTTALAVKSKKSYINKNVINALGDNLGNSSSVDSFAAMTAGINLKGSESIVEENTINSNSRGIFVTDGEVTIENNKITVNNNGLDDSSAIMAENAGIVISDNDVVFEGNGNGSKKNRAVYLKDCDGPEVFNNNFDITLPSCYVDWQEVPPGSGNWVSDPMSEGILIDSPNAIVKDNNISVDYEGVFGSYDTIYAVHINSDNGTVDSNIILAQGHSYIYALEVSGNDFVVENNAITSISDAMYANGIDVEGAANGVVKNNTINVNAPGVTYGIYSSMSNGNVSVDYLDNEITSIAPSAYGMELMGLKENVEGNTFTIEGSDAIAIYSSSKDVAVKDNVINVDGDDTGLAFLGKSGNATITDNEVQVSGEYTIDVSQITSLVKDNYLIADNLTGDASVDYDPETSSVYNNTPKMDKYFLSTDGLEKYFGNSKALEFRLLDSSGNPVANKTITISINGKDYTRKTDANGTARMNINLNAGNYTATASYENQSVDADITILSTIESKDLTKMFRNATQYEATFVDSDGKILKNTNVSFNINGVFYTRKTNENGTAKLNINLEPGEYIITATNPKTSEKASNNITVLSTITDNNNVIKYFRNATQYTVKLLDSQGNAVGAGVKVTFNINGVFYNRTTNASGIAKLNINLEPGKYIITADYNGCKVSNDITVLSTLQTKDLSMKYKDGSKFEAKVLDGQGKPYPGQNVTFNINGVKYTRLSDSNGVSRLNINLMPGTYIITSTYNKLNVSNKITISS